MAPIPTAATDTDAHETARRRLTQSMIKICGQRPCARLVCTLELQNLPPAKCPTAFERATRIPNTYTTHSPNNPTAPQASTNAR
ncbi:hypothetical protein PAXINDRAFT_14774 [Paxillus involutus ATCC 200175]|uniref:Uncharacterized protein n=1 Tax=Paxillus involutus ATCC 200175 TaxID=664439 RepID=A0A0C9T9Y9_PAXIN|nr:hypothetical protein PAXINDRAFT_14774 [Paxillus involutus ATCC 200175]